MGRPKAVNIKTFPLYDKFHTEKEKMYSGVEMTTLYPIKETPKRYESIEVWAHCARKWRRNKEGFELSVNIPILSDEKAIEFLEKNAWHDWKQRQINDKDSDMIETVAMLKKLFPDKEAVYFYELDSILSAYCGGTFISYKDGAKIDEVSDNTLERRKYYTRKYHRFVEDEPCKKMRERWTNETDETKKEEYLTEYHNFERDYVYEHYNLNDTFIKLGENSVCYPVAFTENTAEWSKKEYGKLIAYAHAGEIYFVATADKVYFEVKRHF